MEATLRGLPRSSNHVRLDQAHQRRYIRDAIGFKIQLYQGLVKPASGETSVMLLALSGSDSSRVKPASGETSAMLLAVKIQELCQVGQARQRRDVARCCSL